MHEPRIGLEPDPVARLELMAFAKHRDDVLAAQARLDLRSGRLDHLDLGLGAVVGDREMLGPHAVDGEPAVGSGRRGRERQADAARPVEPGAAVVADRALEEIHRRRADEAGDEQVVRPVVELRAGAPICSTSPSCITTILSAMVMASIWSWVT